jgi:hypothetical protein
VASLGRSVIGRNHSSDDRIAMIADVLALTRPGEFVMDSKGETIYRPRPYYYAIETFTRQRLARGLMPDDLVERLIQTRTAVVHEGDRMTAKSRTFISRNYVSIGRVEVLGQALAAGATGFEVVIPAKYTFVGEHGQLAGTLDGVPLDGPRFLADGHHEFTSDEKAGQARLVWSRAIEAGYSPISRPE